MNRKAFLIIVMVLFVLFTLDTSVLQTSSNSAERALAERQRAQPLKLSERTLKQQDDFRHIEKESIKFDKSYCVIQNDDGTPYWYYANFDSGMGFAVYMDPSQCGANSYPFQITQVHFYLYEPGDFHWPAEVQINIKDLIQADKCKGPGNSLYSEIRSIPSDSAYPKMMNLSLSAPYYVNQPFFMEIVYTQPSDTLHPHPSLLMDELVTTGSDTCDNWFLDSLGYHDWDYWGDLTPGDAIIRAVGYTGVPDTATFLPLHYGWQWVSTNFDPAPANMESIFVNCWDDLNIVKACDGKFCIPGVGCWIPGWSVCEMYKVNMAAACTIQIRGTKVPTNKPCPLPAGWSCIAYFPDCPLEPETALVSIWSNLDIVKNDQGQFCIPGVGCWIECMEPNEGYMVHLRNSDTLIYPNSCPPCPPPLAKRNSFPGFTRTTHFSYLGNSGESYSIVVNSIELNGKQAELGDEIGVFTSSGICVGAGVWQACSERSEPREILGIAVWQDDDRTEAIDGFQDGEQIVFKLWDKSENREIELSANFEKGDGIFGVEAYALVNLKGESSLQLPKEFQLAQNYPNPFNPETKISYALPKDCDVKLTIYNLLGQKIKVLVDEHQTAGYKHVSWDGKDDKGREVASGIYFYRIQAGEFTGSKRMVILK